MHFSLSLSLSGSDGGSKVVHWAESLGGGKVLGDDDDASVKDFYWAEADFAADMHARSAVKAAASEPKARTSESKAQTYMLIVADIYAQSKAQTYILILLELHVALVAALCSCTDLVGDDKNLSSSYDYI